MNASMWGCTQKSRCAALWKRTSQAAPACGDHGRPDYIQPGNPQDLNLAERKTTDDLLKYEVDFKVGKKELSLIVEKCIKVHGTAETAKVLDAIKNLGYHYSTRAALTVAITDATIPPEKQEYIQEAEKRVDTINKLLNAGLSATRNVTVWSSRRGTRPPTR